MFGIKTRCIVQRIGAWVIALPAVACLAQPAAESPRGPQYPLITKLSQFEVDPAPNPLGPELAAEVREIVRRYQHWGMRRVSMRCGSIKRQAGESTLDQIDWSRLETSDVRRERFLRRGDRFRSDCFEPEYDRRSFAFDGSIARSRNPMRIRNGPLIEFGSGIDEPFAPRIPHALLANHFESPSICWLFDESRMVNLIRSGILLGAVRVERERKDNHPCWKITWRTMWENEGGLVCHCVAWLARDRGLLPLRQEFRAGVDDTDMQCVRVTTEGFRRDGNSGLWYPEEAHSCLDNGDVLHCARTTLAATEDHLVPRYYEQIAAMNQAHSKPAQVSVPAHAPFPVLSSLPGPGSVAPSATRSTRLRFAGFGLLGLTLCWAITALTLSKTRLGNLARQSLRRHRGLLGGCGVIFVVSVGWLASYPPGWTTFGLSWMFAGGTGLAWIVFSMWLLGERTVSIRVALFASASAALLFAGYNAGMKRMRVRQQTIHDIRNTGGQVAMGLWRLDETGLFLPDSMGRLMGEAWTGRANRAAVAESQFTARNVHRWCLDEVQWLGITCLNDQPFRLSPEALAQIRDTRALWTLRVEGGLVDGACFEELSRFGSLIDVYFDCQHQPIDARIASIPKLERLWLTHPVVNADLFEKLSRIKTLECVSLIDPTFQQCARPRHRVDFDWVEVHHADVSAGHLEELGKLPCDLVFENCRFHLGPEQQMWLSETPGVTVKGSTLGDRGLMSLAASPRLQSIRLLNTDVSLQGIEAFSSRRPDVTITME